MKLKQDYILYFNFNIHSMSYMYPELDKLLNRPLIQAFEKINGTNPFIYLFEVKKLKCQERLSSFRIQHFEQLCNQFENILRKASIMINQPPFSFQIPLYQYKKINEINQMLTQIFIPNIVQRKKLNQDRLRLLRKIKQNLPLIPGQYEHFIFLHHNIYCRDIEIDYSIVDNSQELKKFRTLLISLKKVLCVQKQHFKNKKSYDQNIDMKRILRKFQVKFFYQQKNKNNQEIMLLFEKLKKQTKNKWLGPRMWQSLLAAGFKRKQGGYFFNEIQQILGSFELGQICKGGLMQLGRVFKKIQRRFYENIKHQQLRNLKQYNQQNKKLIPYNLSIKEEDVDNQYNYYRTSINCEQNQDDEKLKSPNATAPSLNTLIDKPFNQSVRNGQKSDNKLFNYSLYHDDQKGIAYLMIPLYVYKRKQQ